MFTSNDNIISEQIISRKEEFMT